MLGFLHCFYLFCHFVDLVIKHFLFLKLFLFHWVVVIIDGIFVSIDLRLIFGFAYVVQYLLDVFINNFYLFFIKLAYLLVLTDSLFILYHLLNFYLLLEFVDGLDLILDHLVFLDEAFVLRAHILIHFCFSCFICVSTTHFLNDSFILNSVEALICFFSLNFSKLFLSNHWIKWLNWS